VSARATLVLLATAIALSPSVAASVGRPPQPDCPFVAGESWHGEYVCGQGLTALVVRIVSAGDCNRIDAIFDFAHAPTGAAGRYKMRGTYDATTRAITFAPGTWIAQPPGYVTVGMSGTVSADGRAYTGSITNPSCGPFRVERRVR
jgi:hypothetical protein